MKLLGQSFIFKDRSYASGVKNVVLIHDEQNNIFIVKWNWVNFFTKNQFLPYKTIYAGAQREKASQIYQEEKQRWL